MRPYSTHRCQYPTGHGPGQQAIRGAAQPPHGPRRHTPTAPHPILAFVAGAAVCAVLTGGALPAALIGGLVLAGVAASERAHGATARP